MALSPNADQFASVGADKLIVVYDSKTCEKKSSNAAGGKMGLMDCGWYDDEHLFTCSMDNKVKVWEVKDGEIAKDPMFDLMQQATDDKKAQVPKQLVGCWRGQGGEIGAVNLEGDLMTWNPFKQDMAAVRNAGHTDLIKDVCLFNGVICHASQGKVFYTKAGAPTKGQHIDNPELICDILHSNNHSLYAVLTGSEKKIIRMSEAPEEEVAGLKVDASGKLSGFGKAVSGDDEKLFILLNTGEIEVLDAKTLVQTKKHKCAFANPVKMVFSCHTGHLWVGDKKGCVHVLKSDDFSEVGTFAKHTQAVTCMTVSKDGKKIASGDSYRYTYVCDAESMQDTGHYAFQPCAVMDVSFSDDGSHLSTVANDMSFALINLDTKQHKLVKNAHDDKRCKTCKIMPDGKVMTSGEDCAIRIWNLE